MIFDSRILTNKIGVSINDYYRNDQTLEYHTFNYFREGISDEELFNDRKNIVLKCNSDSSFSYRNDFIINNFQMNGNKNNHYYFKDGNYRKDIIFNTETQSFNTMIRGSISGSINIKSCGVDSYTHLEILVYRRPDRQYIGKYPVKSDGTYTVPNLDANSKYDIVLFDSNLKLEQQVHSLREPKVVAVPQVYVAQAYDFKTVINNSQSIKFKFNIRKELYKNYDYCRLVWIGLNGQSYEVIRDYIADREINVTTLDPKLKYGFYKIESVFGDLVTSSDLVEIKEPHNYEIIIPDDEYTPPSATNINVIL